MVSPAGPVSVTVGASNSISITFTTSDVKPATDLAITSGLTPLPVGWSTTTPALTCASITTGDACRLSPSYTPLAATAASTLTLGYRYTDSAGKLQNATTTIDYETAFPTMAYVVNHAREGTPVIQCMIAADGSLTGCKDSGASGLFRPTSIAFNGSTAYISNLGGSITRCKVKDDGSFTDCRSAGDNGLDMPSRVAVIGSHVYAANTGNNTLTSCVIWQDDSLGAGDEDPSNDTCNSVSDPLFNVPADIAVRGSLFYLANTATNSVTVCRAEADGSFSNCRDAGATLLDMPEGLGISGDTAYITSYKSRSVTRCTIGDDGLFSGCASAGLNTGLSSTDIVIYGSTAYLPIGSDNALLKCTVEASGSLSGCIQFFAPPLFDYPISITLR